MNQPIIDFTVLILAAFVPSLIYLIWIRNTERYAPEPYGRLLRIFIFGATASVFMALVVELLLTTLLNMNIERVYDLLGHNPNLSTLILAVLIAPFVEELAKALGVFGSGRYIKELEDGIVFGAAAGLGFAATENLLYESSAYFSEGVSVFIALTVVRSISSALLHASATSMSGLGIARSRRQGRSWIPYYLVAVVMHGTYNLAASFGPLYESQYGQAAYLVGLLVAIAIAVIGISVARGKIRALEAAPG